MLAQEMSLIHLRKTEDQFRELFLKPGMESGYRSSDALELLGDELIDE
ncbi:hypothetical protein [Halorientalis halophila]